MTRILAAVLSILLLGPQTVWACGVSASAGPRVMRASTAEDVLTIRFLGHASFLLRTPAGVRVVTDYSGAHTPPEPPDVVTMNHAHSTHFTDHPDPRIRVVLHGWRDDGQPARIDVVERDLRIHNLATNIRNYGGGTEYYGNSIFVFETAGLCVAHLGHLHHLLTEEDLASLGVIDVVMAPVDGGYTLSQDDMAAVLAQLHPRLVLPMHYFSTSTLNRFLDRVRDQYVVRISDSPSLVLSRSTLPSPPEVLVLPGPFF